MVTLTPQLPKLFVEDINTYEDLEKVADLMLGYPELFPGWTNINNVDVDSTAIRFSWEESGRIFPNAFLPNTGMVLVSSENGTYHVCSNHVLEQSRNLPPELLLPFWK